MKYNSDEYEKPNFVYYDNCGHCPNARFTLYTICFDQHGNAFEADVYSIFCTEEKIRSQKQFLQNTRLWRIRSITNSLLDHKLMLMDKRRWDRLFRYAKRVEEK